jgi:pyrroline-5-carboxylate reductase
MNTPKVAVLGVGKMAGALVRGWLAAGALTPERVKLWNRTPLRALLFAETTECVVANTPEEAVSDAEMVLVAVKPYGVLETLQAIRDALPGDALVVSVAAGVGLEAMESVLGPGVAVVRAMPNTPAMISAGASAYCRGKRATDAHAARVHDLFSAVGETAEVTEAQIDAVIGVSGSGVAYFYLFLEALTDGGVRAGLPRDVAKKLAAQTALGAARMVLESGEHPAALKDAVTTPGGTTIAALEVLETAGLRGTVMRAVLAARDRARELG